MSNDPTTPATTTPPAGDDGPQQPQGLSFGQHVFIWSMIILVGVIFGVGSTVGVLQQGHTYVDDRRDVTQTDVSMRQRVATKLERHLNPYGEFALNNPRFWVYITATDYAGWAEQIRFARVAELAGLLPTGEAREALVARFLQERGPGDRTHAAILSEVQGTKDGVTRQELAAFLAERQALRALSQRLAPSPVLGEALASVVPRESLTVREVILDGSHLLPTVAADDPEIAAAYDTLRASRFATPSRVDLAVAYADVQVLRGPIATSLTETDLQAWYDAHPDTFTTLDPGSATAAPVRQPLANVRDDVRSRLSAERAPMEALRLAEAFATSLETTPITTAEAFAAAAAAAGLQITDVAVPEPAPGAAFALGNLGQITDQPGFFNRANAPGMIASPLTTTTEGADGVGQAVIIRLAARHDAGYRPLSEVTAQVQAYVAARRAWKDVLAQAEAVRTAAQGTGLAAWAASDGATAWKPALTTVTSEPGRRISAPPSDLGGPLGTDRLLAELAMPDLPVALDAVAPADPTTGSADLPRIRLVQVEGVAPPTAAADPADSTRRLQQLVGQALGAAARTRLRVQLGDE
jgi:hypothetical protein